MKKIEDIKCPFCGSTNIGKQTTLNDDDVLSKCATCGEMFWE